MTILYSVLHMLVDGMCAMAMFGTFLSGRDGYYFLLLYNFCAFALQMPLGVVLDYLCLKLADQKERLPFFFAAAGVLCTGIGAVTHPVVLGIGNALFHIGGGVGTIYEDRAKAWRGKGLGVFVAPGALGLYLGTQIAGSGIESIAFPFVCLLMLLLCAGAAYILRVHGGGRESGASENQGNGVLAAQGNEALAAQEKRRFSAGSLRLTICCLAVVILRADIGMAVIFPWKTTVFLGVTSVLAIVCGKAAGGFLAARFGYLKTAAFSLALAALCYLFSDAAPAGLAALFLFNMTMPVTLYLLICEMPRLSGFAFGLLTFGLFLGFLPEYFGIQPAVSGSLLGCVGSVVSLLLLLIGIRQKGGSSDCLSG